MPKTQTVKINDAIDALKHYADLDHDEAVEALSKNLPIKDETPAEPLTRYQHVNTAYSSLSLWFLVGRQTVSKLSSHVNDKIIHNEALTASRRELVLDCLINIDKISNDDAKLELLDKLVVDNMQLSLLHLGEDQTYSGNLHRCLCQALELTNSDANKLCTLIGSDEPKSAAPTK